MSGVKLKEELVAAQYKRDYARVTELRSSLVEVKEKKAEINIRFAPPAPLGPPDGSKKKDRPATHAGTAPEVQQNLEDDSGTESLDTPSPLVRGVSPETRAVQVMPESAAAAIAAGSWGSPAIPVAVPVYVTFPTSAYYEVQALYPASGPINPGYYMQNVAGGGGFMNPAYYHGGYSAEAVASYGPAAGGMPGQQSYAGFPQQGYGGGRSY